MRWRPSTSTIALVPFTVHTPPGSVTWFPGGGPDLAGAVGVDLSPTTARLIAVGLDHPSRGPRPQHGFLGEITLSRAAVVFFDDDPLEDSVVCQLLRDGLTYVLAVLAQRVVEQLDPGPIPTDANPSLPLFG